MLKIYRISLICKILVIIMAYMLKVYYVSKIFKVLIHGLKTVKPHWVISF